MQVVGIEIGGTKLQLGRADLGTGEILELTRADIDRSQGAQGILATIDSVLSRWRSEQPLTGVAFGFGGPVERQSGRVTTSHQVAGWDGFPLVAWVDERYGLPAWLGNDCDVACLAEARAGAGRSSDSVFYVTVGTGIGGGLTVAGESFGVHRPAIAEIGHLRCGSGEADSTVESIASGLGIESRFEALFKSLSSGGSGGSVADRDLEEIRKQLIGRERRLTARELGLLAASGNTLAISIFDQAARALGWAIAQAMALIAPDVFVVGGGVTLADHRVFLDPLKRYATASCFAPLRHELRIRPAELGEDVVVRGAIELARSTISG